MRKTLMKINLNTTISASNDNNTNNTNSIPEEKDNKNRISHPTFIIKTNKKNKNLINCYLCKIEDCQKIFETYKEKAEHEKTHIKIHVCPIDGCNKSYKDIINLKKHLKFHFPTEKRYFCPFEGCGKCFTASYNLKIHYRIHICKMPYECKKCGRKFFDKANYKYHNKYKHINISSEKLTCQHRNCNHRSKTIKQKLMHHNKIEELCIKEKNLLINLLMIYQENIVCLLKNEANNNNNGEKNKIINNNIANKNNFQDDNKLKEIKKYEFDEDLKSDLNKIILQSKVVYNCAIDKEIYHDLVDDL